MGPVIRLRHYCADYELIEPSNLVFKQLINFRNHREEKLSEEHVMVGALNKAGLVGVVHVELDLLAVEIELSHSLGSFGCGFFIPPQAGQLDIQSGGSIEPYSTLCKVYFRPLIQNWE